VVPAVDEFPAVVPAVDVVPAVVPDVVPAVVDEFAVVFGVVVDEFAVVFGVVVVAFDGADSPTSPKRPHATRPPALLCTTKGLSLTLVAAPSATASMNT
jgi:hypothetical protein